MIENSSSKTKFSIIPVSAITIVLIFVSSFFIQFSPYYEIRSSPLAPLYYSDETNQVGLTPHSLNMNFSIVFTGDYLDYQPTDHKTHPAVFDLTNIAMRGIQNYEVFRNEGGFCGYENQTEFQILGWNEKAQRCMVYANYLLSSGNYFDHEDWISHPNNVGGSFTGLPFEWGAKYCDGMGEALAAQLFFHVDDLLDTFGIDNPIYLEMAKKCIQSITTPIELGGALMHLPDGTIWLTHHRYERRVLNGFMYALNTIQIIRSKVNSTELDSIFEDGIFSLKQHISKYLRGWNQMYDLVTPASKIWPDSTVEEIPYYTVHPYLLQKLAVISNDSALLEWHDRFIISYAIEGVATPQIEVSNITQSTMMVKLFLTLPSGNNISVVAPSWVAWDDDQSLADTLAIDFELLLESGGQWIPSGISIDSARMSLNDWSYLTFESIDPSKTYKITANTGPLQWEFEF